MKVVPISGLSQHPEVKFIADARVYDERRLRSSRGEPVQTDKELSEFGEIVRGAYSVCDTLCTVCCLFEITEEDHVDVTEGVRGRAWRSAWWRSPVLVEGAENTFQGFPSIVVKHAATSALLRKGSGLRLDPGVWSDASIRNIETSSSIRHSMLTKALTRSLSNLARLSLVSKSMSSQLVELCYTR